MKFCLFLCLTVTLFIFAECMHFGVPIGHVTIEVNEDKGFRVIYNPDSESDYGDEVEININKDLGHYDDGEFQGELEEKDDKFVYENTEIKIKEGDRIHFRVKAYGDDIGNCRITGQYEYNGAGLLSEIDESSLSYSCSK